VQKIIHRHECDLARTGRTTSNLTPSCRNPKSSVKSKRDSEDENVILPTIDPFNTPDEHLPQVTPTSLNKEAGEQNDHDTDC
jgi:hypothetical protein